VQPSGEHLKAATGSVTRHGGMLTDTRAVPRWPSPEVTPRHHANGIDRRHAVPLRLRNNNKDISRRVDPFIIRLVINGRPVILWGDIDEHIAYLATHEHECTHPRSSSDAPQPITADRKVAGN
jgi:hypothetical protein